MALLNSIGCWNSEMTEYSLNNSGFDFLEKSDIGSEKDPILNVIMYYTTFSFNFIFFDSIFLPFLRKNDRYVTENIHEILYSSLCDLSCFFPNELMKYPSININYRSSENQNTSLLSKAIIEYNKKAVEMLFKYPDLQYQTSFYNGLSPLHLACTKFSDMKIIQLICKDDDPLINIRKSASVFTPFYYAVVNANFYAVEKIIGLCFDSEKRYFYFYITHCMKRKNLFTLKILLKYFFNNILIKIDDLIDNYKETFSTDANYESEFPDMIMQVYKEL